MIEHPQTADECRNHLERLRSLVDDYLVTVIPEDDRVPETLRSAIRYSLDAGGKRLRPILTLLAYESFDHDPSDIIRPACALELIHTYSLIHDDLPCMDDDDFRRGQPTLHRKYNDAIAVLAGDALHALAFELLSSARNNDVVREVSRAIGIFGMLAGQVADVEAEGNDITREQIEFIHRNKTGALIEASLKIGAMLGGAENDRLSTFSEYGQRIGLAFQIIDDVLDITGSQDKLGKDIGSDDRNLKATYPRVIGLEESRAFAKKLIDEAKEEIAKIGPASGIFKFIGDFILMRDS